MHTSVVSCVLLLAAVSVQCIENPENGRTSLQNLSDIGDNSYPDELPSGQMAVETRSFNFIDDYTIPLEMIERINNAADATDFFEEMIDKSSVNPSDSSFRSGRLVKRDINGPTEMPKPAGCKTEMAVVKLTPDGYQDPSVIYFPPCTRVPQCSGCCSHDLLSCQPTEVRERRFELTKARYTGKNKLEYLGKVVQVVDEHISCKCDCRTKPEDCTGGQVYEKATCQCKCTNTHEQNKCLSEQDYKLWDSTKCQCRCRERMDCSSGTFFDAEECKCKPQSLIKTPVQQIQMVTSPRKVDRKPFIPMPTYVVQSIEKK